MKLFCLETKCEYIKICKCVKCTNIKDCNEQRNSYRENKGYYCNVKNIKKYEKDTCGSFIKMDWVDEIKLGINTTKILNEI